MSLQEGLVLISGLPESGWSESDIITLVQPYGVLSDLIIAAELGNVRLSEKEIISCSMKEREKSIAN